ncbi:peroxiredoxin-like family protein [Aquimarina hainanensis]|uniref:thioredoxin-dependent peroxiredoxin n=1 Tax=Aquimarina hainanensis TaxID=1578017 RepID=A0ABW5NCT4_9FLAO|nr:peroxiredoxin-like family protein [Aquimarina sp. TRL1]QKX06372.1 AhpC/TSA family protein [Aquimarina sp. TRL1]
MSLTKDLKAYADLSATKIPQASQKVMGAAIEQLRTEKILAQALKKGNKIPEITLPNANGKQVSVQDILKEKKVVLSFYRGGWCPYCNLELKALQNVLPEIEKNGATLVAISPETPDHSLSTTEKNELSFQVLSDKDNVVAKNFNLTFALPDELVEIYKSFNIDVETSNGNSDHELPISATYIIEQDGTISYDYLEEDYKKRADPQDIINQL